MQVDGYVLTYLIIGFFAVNGYLRGWWKEAVTTTVLFFLFVLLNMPSWAALIVESVNLVVGMVWDLITFIFSRQLIDAATNEVIAEARIDPTSPGTWMIILILALGGTALLSRDWLPSTAYKQDTKLFFPDKIARILGVMIGVINGILVLSLAREYIDGRSLPGSTPVSASDAQLTLVGQSAFGPAASSVSIEAVDLPHFTLLDSFVPWFIGVVGILLVFATFSNKLNVDFSSGAVTHKPKPPYGYKELDIPKAAKKPGPQEVKVIN